MSTAEVTAWMAGYQTATEVLAETDEPIPDHWLTAIARLGPERFAYWMLRGAQDQARDHDGPH